MKLDGYGNGRSEQSGQFRQLILAPDMSGKVRTTWISDYIWACPEKRYGIQCPENIGQASTYYQVTKPRGGYSVRKLLGVCRGPLKIGPKKTEGKMVFWGQKDRILRGFVLKRSFLCWWMRKNTPKRSCSILPKWKKGVKTAAHMYHPSHREYPPRERNSDGCKF